MFTVKSKTLHTCGSGTFFVIKTSWWRNAFLIYCTFHIFTFLSTWSLQCQILPMAKTTLHCKLQPVIEIHIKHDKRFNFYISNIPVKLI